MSEKNDWQLVADVRSGLLRRWLPLAAAIMIFVILQTVGGRYEEGNTTLLAWIWLTLGILPGTLLLYFSSWLNKYPAKLIAPSANRTLRGISLAHLVLMLLTLLLLPFALLNMTTTDYFTLSFLWVIPSTILVTGGFVLLFFRKESRLRPSAEILKNVADKEAGKARESGDTARLQCLELVAANELGQALEQLRTYFKDKADETNQVVMLQGRFKNVTDKLQKGLVEEGEAQLEVNKITEALLNLSKLVG